MFQVRIHGRGGQGVVTTSEILALAWFLEGRHAQAFPSFGSERTGAPVASFVRMSPTPVRTRQPVIVPDALVVQDATLLHQPDVLAGLRRDGWVVVNSVRTPAQLGLTSDRTGTHEDHVVTVPASEIATRHVGRYVPGPALLGALAGLTGVVSLEALVAAVRERLAGPVGQANAAATTEAYALARGLAAAPEGVRRATAG